MTYEPTLENNNEIIGVHCMTKWKNSETVQSVRMIIHITHYTVITTAITESSTPFFVIAALSWKKKKSSSWKLSYSNLRYQSKDLRNVGMLHSEIWGKIRTMMKYYYHAVKR